MNLNKSASELLERYMLGVRRALSRDKRDDIAREIESSILDRLDEQFPEKEEISEKDLKLVLVELGSPYKLAGEFSPQRYLIGPQFFTIYTFVLRIVVPVVIGALLLSIVIGAIAGNYADNGFPFWEYLGTLWNGAIMAAAFVTLTFAIIERVNTDKDIEELKELEEFKIEDLPELSEQDKEPSAAESVFEIIFGVIGLAFLTYIADSGGRVPVFWNAESQGMVGLFTQNFLRFVPVMMAITGLEVARSATMLAQGRRSALTNWWYIVMQGANLIVNGLLLGSLPLIALEGFEALGFAANWDMVRVNDGVNLGLRIILILAVVGTSIDIIVRLVREFRNPAK